MSIYSRYIVSCVTLLSFGVLLSVISETPLRSSTDGSGRERVTRQIEQTINLALETSIWDVQILRETKNYN